MLSSAFDVIALRESIKSAKRFFAAPAWKHFVLGIVGPLANATTDQDLEEFVRNSVFPSGHIVGTAAMSAKGVNHGVVDPDLRLKRASGLRVVDASVMVRTALKCSLINYRSRLVFLTAVCDMRAHTSARLHYGRESC